MTKVLIDSSSWIHFFKQKKLAQYEAVAKLLSGDLALICGPVLTEVLRGARNEKEMKVLKGYFELLEYFPLEKTDHLQAAELGFDLARKGVVVKTMDLLIAHLAIREKTLLLHDDEDFEMIARHSFLKTVRPS